MTRNEIFQKAVEQARAGINGLVNNESSKEHIDAVASAGKNLDELSNQFADLEKENKELKDMLIDQVKNKGFSDKPKDDTHTEDNEKTIEGCLDKVLANRKK